MNVSLSDKKAALELHLLESGHEVSSRPLLDICHLLICDVLCVITLVMTPRNDPG
jgi:hypothetical protein